MTITALTQARNIVRQLTTQEKIYLLNDITAQLVQEATGSSANSSTDFPVFHVAEWPTDMPVRREDLYDDRGHEPTFLDTNILVYASVDASPFHSAALSAVYAHRSLHPSLDTIIFPTGCARPVRIVLAL